MSDESTRPLPSDGDSGDDTVLDDPVGVPAEEAPSHAAPVYQEDTGGRHPLSVTHLVAGLVFLGIATSWLLRETGALAADATGWFLPLTLVLAGAVGLVAWVGSARRKPR